MADEPARRGSFVRRIPEGDNRLRQVCADCGYVQYENPKVVVGSVCTWEEKVLRCRRDIEPRRGFWTLPAGYLEVNETSADGAMREAWEEAYAKIAIESVLAVYNVPRISQVQIIYRARLLSPEVAPGVESQDVGLFDWSEIPWGELAFPTVRWALYHFREVADLDEYTARTNPPGELGDY